jgi:penicillin-binding protein 1B
VPLYQGLASSLNLATVNLGMSLGLSKVSETLYRLGAQRRFKTVPAMLLGAVPLSPLEVAQVYQTIAAGGYRAPLRAIREVMDQSGRPLNRYPLAVEAAVDPRAAYLTTWAMEQVVRQGTAKWLGSRLPKGLTMAGKTGTTDDKRDSWFAGFSGDKVAVVWVGRDDNKPMGLAGGQGALPVWAEFMLALPNEPLSDEPPEGVVLSGACGRSGIPYISGSSGAACGGGDTNGGGGGDSDAPDRESAGAVAQTQPGRSGPGEPAAKPKPKPKAKPKPENHFLDL